MKKLIIAFAFFALFVSNCTAQAHIQFFTIESTKMTIQEQGEKEKIEIPVTTNLSQFADCPTGTINIEVVNDAPLSMLFEYTDAKGKVYRTWYKEPRIIFQMKVYVQEGEKYRFTPYTETKTIQSAGQDK